MQWPLAMLDMVLVLAQSTWIMLAALAVKVASLSAHTVPLSVVSMGIRRMLE